jgi:hypothetical protein
LAGFFNRRPVFKDQLVSKGDIGAAGIDGTNEQLVLQTKEFKV